MFTMTTTFKRPGRNRLGRVGGVARTKRAEEFAQQGYVLVRSILDETLARHAIEQATVVLNRAADLPEPQAGVEYELDVDPLTGRHALRRLSNVIERDAAFRSVATHPIVCKWVRDLLGERSIELCLNRHNMMIVKPAYYGSENVWHSDAGSWLNDRLISFMYLLDPATTANGCLEVVPGSHRHGIPHEGEGFLDLTNPENERWIERGVAVEMEPGDGLFFHSCLLHYSAANRSSQSRRNLVFAYGTSDAKAVDRNQRPLETLSL